MQRILGAVILAAGIIYGILIVYRALKDKEKFRSERGSFLWLLPAEALVFFISASGISDFVMNTIAARRLRTADDGHLPGTLVASTLVPGSIIAFSLLQNEGALHWSLLVFCSVASMSGSLIGVRLVSRFNGDAIRKIMAAALLFSMAALIVRMIVSRGATGEASFLSAPKLVIAVIILFFTGALNMFGIPMKATWAAVFLLLGLSPLSSLTLTLVLASLTPLAGGYAIVRSGNYHQKTAVAAATAGALGAVLGVVFALSLSPLVLNIVLIGVMIVAIVSLLK